MAKTFICLCSSSILLLALIFAHFISELPTAPSNLKVGTVSGDNVTLSWDAPKGGAPFDNYVVEMYSMDNPEFIERFKVDAGSKSFRAEGLQEGTEYMFMVKTENPVGTSKGAAELDNPVLAGVFHSI